MDIFAHLKQLLRQPMDMNNLLESSRQRRFFDVHSCRVRGCGGNEHQKQIEADRGYTDSSSARGGATHNPFAALQGLLKKP